jgi:hypothetical protein
MLTLRLLAPVIAEDYDRRYAKQFHHTDVNVWLQEAGFL